MRPDARLNAPKPLNQLAAAGLALLLSLAPLGAAQAAEAPAAAAAAAAVQTTSAGHTFTPADGFALGREGALLRLTAPEGDAQLAIIDVPQANSAEEAVAQAWALAHPGFKRTLRLATPRPPRSGWEEQRVFDYETSPNERLSVQAIARRAGTAWVVVTLEAADATLEKRGAPIGKMLTSLRPKGYERESFAGRKPKPLDAERIAALQAFVAKGMQQLDIPGVGFSLIDGSKVVFEGGLGVRQLGKPTPVDAHTLFMAASNTKAMTTALLAQAVDAGKLRWDQPAAQAYPGFRLGDAEVTKQVLIKHLVCACTGLPRQDLEWLFGDGRAAPTTSFEQLSVMKPTSQFGEVFQYSNLMVAAGGYIAAAALAPGQEVGAAYDRLMAERLFKPLGMLNTTFDYAKALGGNHAEPHGDDLQGRTQPARMDLNYTIVPARPAGAVWTSPHDFSRYVLMELGRGRSPEGQQLVSEQNLLARYQPQIMVGEDNVYGMGLFINKQDGVTVVSHGGDMLGFHSNMFWLPEFGIGGTILTNSDSGVLLRGPFLRKLLELVFEGKPEADERLRLAAENRKAEAAKNRELLTMPVPKAVADTLAARYASPALGSIKVSRQQGQVFFQFDHWKSEVALRKAEDGTQSFVTIDPGIGGIEFVRGDGKGPRALILRDAQHEYRFVEAAAGKRMAAAKP
ncbi:serine hydrolase [Paucibacter sediminis]|uniref:Serine hydrolase n=1 Tax=Paucibacter sediminis TaxID=3019553 RepID=A0AA95SR28_9BURK|nr:serine hydrolase domain-containing protein [Paucibacter sp. S2-9]WIT12756.1 serine hydrolase [Paucibacter sp. S2-9]